MIMGEYYDWVNIDKKEYICPCDFGLGNKLHETAFAGNHFLGALYNLLSSDWKGDAIVFLGDETHITEKDSKKDVGVSVANEIASFINNGLTISEADYKDGITCLFEQFNNKYPLDEKYYNLCLELFDCIKTENN